eukprot:CAMPEP_0185732342 /NCGR_PEP_ID=MMETSP1171-20130828/15831_1 /TAXON_ID=374046 /ORGANISM="Helicotheca tamensis, Strain CCMP826" /LENGTH=372 /DNA_ID=CAMNT_0028401801 /DNA_START=132 /DNA_END=1250 /DNA_ORIENTATION=+
MKSFRQLMLLALLAKAHADSEDRFLSSRDSNADDDAFFAFSDNTLWDNYSIMPQQCIKYNGEDVVVFSLHTEGNNHCAKKKQGLYYATVGNFLRGYNRQQKDNSDLKGYDFERPAVMDYVDCTYTYINNQEVYAKLGCNSQSGGTGITLHAFSDMYCTEKMSYNTNALGLDMSGVRIRFGVCEDCVYWPNNYDADANAEEGEPEGEENEDADAGNFEEYHAYQSPLCSAANYYKETCDRSCRKVAKASYARRHRGFSFFGKIMLFVFCLIGLFSLLAVRGQRMKMSKEHALMEEAAVKKAGLEMKNIGLIIIVVAFLILICILAKLVFLTWFLLLTTDAILIGYWLFLHFRSTGKTEIGGFRVFGSAAGEVA